MNKFLVMAFLGFTLIMSVGLAYADECTNEEETKGSWAEVELVGEEDGPMASEAYEIDLPDGSTIEEGGLDVIGETYSSGFAPGGSQVTFPDSDDEAWEKE